MSGTWQVIEGDALLTLRGLDAGSAQTCVTSPPYFGLRDYGHEGQIGLEATPDEYVAALVEVFREVRRVLRDDGTLWLNLGDTYAGRADGSAAVTGRRDKAVAMPGRQNTIGGEIKRKDLIGIPWMTAFALRADGWYLRAEIIWDKPNGLPGGGAVVSKPDRFHEQIFLLAKQPTYFYDAAAIREPDSGTDHPRKVLDGQPSLEPSGGVFSGHSGIRTNGGRNGLGRNKRSVWRVPVFPFPDAHFAAFPPKLIEPCILAGSAVGDTVLDPFAGAGTTGVVATRHGRGFVGIELNPEYAEMARRRIRDDAPLLNYLSEAAA